LFLKLIVSDRNVGFESFFNKNGEEEQFQFLKRFLLKLDELPSTRLLMRFDVFNTVHVDKTIPISQ